MSTTVGVERECPWIHGKPLTVEVRFSKRWVEMQKAGVEWSQKTPTNLEENLFLVLQGGCGIFSMCSTFSYGVKNSQKHPIKGKKALKTCQVQKLLSHFAVIPVK